MKIKEIALRGFRSFSDNFVVNVIDGANANVAFLGSREKMNEFFKVLSLALSFSNDPGAFFEAELIAHGGATVTITFIYSEESSVEYSYIDLERTITRAKVSNKLDGNVAERIEVVHFLEMLGFSRSHPYTFHIQIDDIERLARVDEVATPAINRGKMLQKLVGTKEFLKSKAKAQRILSETEDEIQKIDTLLRKFNVQLEIYATNEASVAYEKLSARKQMLEQCSRAKKVTAIRESIAKWTADIEQFETFRAQNMKTMCQVEVAATKNRKKKSEVNLDIVTVSAERRKSIAALTEMNNMRDLLDEHVANCRSQLQADELILSFSENEKTSVSQTLEQKQRDLIALTIEYNRLTERSNDLCQQMVPLEMSCQQLMMKAAQNTRMNWTFVAEDDRNAWIDNEIQSLAKEIKRKESQMKRHNTEFETKQRLFDETKIHLKNKDAKLEEYGSVLEKDLDEEVVRLNRKREAALTNKQNVKEQMEKQRAMSNHLAEQYQEKENEFAQIIGESLFNGLKSMERILDSENCSLELRHSHHGLVIDHVKSSNDDAAVGVLAGIRLFHHIVKNASAATQFFRLINEEQLAGEIFFITLEEFNNSGDIDTLLSLDTITPPDPFYGELNETMVSCIPIYRERMKLIDMQNTSAHELSKLDYKLDSLMLSIQSTEKEIEAAMDSCERFKRDLTDTMLINRNLNDIEAKMKVKAMLKIKISDELHDLMQWKLRLESERKLTLLTPDEQRAVDDVRRKITAMADEYRKNVDAMNEKRAKRNHLNDFIEKFLKRKQRDLNDVSISYTTQAELLDRDTTALSDTITSISDLEANLNALTGNIEALNCISTAIATELQMQRKQKRDMSVEINAQVHEKSRLLNEINRLNAELAKFGADVTTAMPEFDENITELTAAELQQELEELNHQLCVFKENNEFDVGRLENFKMDKQRLNQQLAELKDNGIELRRLIETMDVENGNATREMMSRLQTTFANIFKRIIDGKGSSARLELSPVVAVSNGNETESIRELEIYCRFPSDQPNESELSLGQLTINDKTIVALIFFFAVLQCSPYGFYMLDHIDDHIDAHYRQRIAEYIEERSSESQFFIASCHTELLTKCENILEFAQSMTYQHTIMRRIRPNDDDCAESN